MAKSKQKRPSIKSNKNTSKENPIKSNSDGKNIKFEFKIKNPKFRAFIPFAIAALFFASIWIFKPAGPVIDPWYAAVKLVDSSNKVQNPQIKKNILDEGGRQLKELVKEYPFHGRIHFFLGYYYFTKRQWDSALTELKISAKMDSGATINAFWPQAHDLIIKSSINMSIVSANQNKIQESEQYLLSAIPYNPNDPLLNKFLGSFYLNHSQIDKALIYYLKSLNANPKDAQVSNNIGLIYMQRKQIETAIPYFKRALSLNPNLAVAKDNLNRALSIQKQ